MGKVTFPKIGNKETYSPLFSARHLMKGKEHIPKKVLLVYSRRMPAKLRRVMGLRSFKHSAGDTGAYHFKKFISKDRRLFVMMIPGGAPITATAVEEAIACGGRQFLIAGTAGAINLDLNISDIVLCDSAIRDDGTSHHYLRNSKHVGPDKNLYGALRKGMIRMDIPFVEGTTWTIDAPYAETRKEIRHYRNEGVLTVEMEAAALFAVAKKRKVRAAAAFTISDILGKEWSGFAKEHHKSGLMKLALIAKIFKDARTI